MADKTTGKKSYRRLNASDLEVEPVVSTEVEKALGYAPAGSIEVHLSSNGQLGLPATVHVKDYTFDDAVALSELDDDHQYSILLPVFKNVVCEDIDISKATLPDMMEVFMSIIGTWYSPTIEDLPYYVNDHLEGDALTSRENISKASIPIGNIQTRKIDPGSRAPITLQKGDGVRVSIDIPRPAVEVLARKYMTEVDSDLLEQLSSKKSAYDSGHLNEKESRDYELLERQKNLRLMRYINAYSIVELDGKAPSNMEERLSMIEKVPLSYWGVYSKVFSSKFDYGVRPEVRFRCTITNKMITRSFPFRLSTFIPTMDKTGDSGFDVHLG